MNKSISIVDFQVWAVLLVALVAVSGAAAVERQVRELTLNECIGVALENNLDLKIETLTRQMTGRDVEVARGGYDPNLTVSAKRANVKTVGESAGTASGALDVLGSKSESDTWTTSVGGVTALGGLSYEVGGRMGDSSGHRDGNPFDTSTGSAGITLTQPLLKGFKTGDARYRVSLAQKQSAEAAIQQEGRLQAVLAQVEATWYSLIQARESIRVQEDAVRLATQLYEDNRRKVQIGAMSMLDEKQAESQAASARADLSSSKRAFTEVQNQLKALLYADHRSLRGVDIAAVGEMSSAQVEVDAEISGERALETRADLRQARLALERQGLTVDYQRNQTLPSLDLVGGYGVAASREDSYGNVLDQMGSADEPYWNVGVTLSIPLGNRAARARAVQSLEAADRMRLQLRQLEEGALVEVDNAVASVETGFERLEATREARLYAEQALEAEQRKLDNGKSTSFVVLQLQRALTQARNSEIQALADYNRQMSVLALAEGSMLERHGVIIAGE